MLCRPLKHKVKIEYMHWTMHEMKKQLEDGVKSSDVRLNIGKPELKDKGAEWLFSYTKTSKPCQTPSGKATQMQAQPKYTAMLTSHYPDLVHVHWH